MRRVESQEGEVVHLFSIDLDAYRLNDDDEDFLAACLDTWASISLLCREQAEAY